MLKRLEVHLCHLENLGICANFDISKEDIENKALSGRRFGTGVEA